MPGISWSLAHPEVEALCALCHRVCRATQRAALPVESHRLVWRCYFPVWARCAFFQPLIHFSVSDALLDILGIQWHHMTVIIKKKRNSFQIAAVRGQMETFSVGSVLGFSIVNVKVPVIVTSRRMQNLSSLLSHHPFRDNDGQQTRSTQESLVSSV